MKLENRTLLIANHSLKLEKIETETPNLLYGDDYPQIRFREFDHRALKVAQ